MAEQSKHVSKGMDSGQLVTISFHEDGTGRIKAPLPDNFGISVGSEYTDPYNQNMTDSLGGLGTVLENVGRVAGVSRKLGVATTIFYSGPEPTEISFDLEFSAYYDAKKEVVDPIKKLMRNSVGREISTDDLDEEEKEEIDERTDGALSSDLGQQIANKAALIKGPSLATIRFGKTIKIQSCYIQSVGVQFSNVLDNQFYPVHGVASVTARIEQNPVRSDVDRFFNEARG